MEEEETEINQVEKLGTKGKTRKIFALNCEIQKKKK